MLVRRSGRKEEKREMERGGEEGSRGVEKEEEKKTI